MDKTLLHELILEALETTLQTALNAAKQAHDSATHEENVAENKYDTLGLEASYLAEGQAARVVECEEDVSTFNKLAIQNFGEDDKIALGALVSLVDEEGNETSVFLSPVSGGLQIDWKGKTTLLVTPQAPLGQALLGSYLGDDLSVGVKHYEVIELA